MFNHNILFLFAFLYEILIGGTKDLSINLGTDPIAGATEPTERAMGVTELRSHWYKGSLGKDSGVGKDY